MRASVLLAKRSEITVFKGQDHIEGSNSSTTNKAKPPPPPPTSPPPQKKRRKKSTHALRHVRTRARVRTHTHTQAVTQKQKRGVFSVFLNLNCFYVVLYYCPPPSPPRSVNVLRECTSGGVHMPSSLYLLAVQARVTVGDSGLCYCCVSVTSFQR